MLIYVKCADTYNKWNYYISLCKLVSSNRLSAIALPLKLILHLVWTAFRIIILLTQHIFLDILMLEWNDFSGLSHLCVVHLVYPGHLMTWKHMAKLQLANSPAADQPARTPGNPHGFLGNSQHMPDDAVYCNITCILFL